MQHVVHCRSGTEEQYAEKEQLLQEIVDIERYVEEKPKKRRAWLLLKSVMWLKSSVHKR